MWSTENNVEQSAADTKTSNGSKSRRQAKESDGINQIIRIHTDQHRAVLNDIDEAIQTVLETGELPLFENGMNRCICDSVCAHNIIYHMHNIIHYNYCVFVTCKYAFQK